MEDEEFLEPLSRLPSGLSPEPIEVCKCLISAASSQEIISARKTFVYSAVSRTENYLREHRIPELIRFLLTKILSRDVGNVTDYVSNLLDQCMIFRAGFGVAPVLYEQRHLEAVVKSFDPGHRGWLSAGQVRRAFTTLGLTPPSILEDRIPTDELLNKLRKIQEQELFELLCAGVPGFAKEDSTPGNSATSSTD